MSLDPFEDRDEEAWLFRERPADHYDLWDADPDRFGRNDDPPLPCAAHVVARPEDFGRGTVWLFEVWCDCGRASREVERVEAAAWLSGHFRGEARLLLDEAVERRKAQTAAFLASIDGANVHRPDWVPALPTRRRRGAA